MGSLELIGNPTSFISNILTGVYDLLFHSLQAVKKGTTKERLRDIQKGTTSLFFHLSSGTLTSLSDLSSALAKNIDKLSLDEDYIEQRINSRKISSHRGFFRNVFNGFGGLAFAIFDGLVKYIFFNFYFFYLLFLFFNFFIFFISFF